LGRRLPGRRGRCGGGPVARWLERRPVHKAHRLTPRHQTDQPPPGRGHVLGDGRQRSAPLVVDQHGGLRSLPVVEPPYDDTPVWLCVAEVAFRDSHKPPPPGHRHRPRRVQPPGRLTIRHLRSEEIPTISVRNPRSTAIGEPFGCGLGNPSIPSAGSVGRDVRAGAAKRLHTATCDNRPDCRNLPPPGSNATEEPGTAATRWRAFAGIASCAQRGRRR
jgi:hypothetical protein